jgi:ATP-binding cassette subfamily B protein/subfamily B ATP-binding cassette protein MsbA
MTDHPMSVTELTVVFGLLIGATEPLRKLSGVINGINSGSAAANLLYPLLDTPTQIVSPSDPQVVAKPHRIVEFQDVTFSYDGMHDVLTNVNLTISLGERLAIVGANGSGKSTLVNLLCRFYDPQQGAVLIDGVSLTKLAISDLRNRIAIVAQQSDFFNETILHNIRYGRWQATDEEVVEAAKRARAHDFIVDFQQGYQTLVGPNGQRLSGGQRQRIALARAILRNAEILILDEATSQIDVESELLIHAALLEFSRGRTMIMITHRKSTLELATRVVQVDRGRVIESKENAFEAA